MSNNMKTAVIYFEGKEVCSINFDKSNQLINSTDGTVYWTKFFLNEEEVAFFSKDYGYVIKSQKLTFKNIYGW